MRYIVLLFLFTTTFGLSQSIDSSAVINQWASEARLIEKQDSLLYEKMFFKCIKSAQRNKLGKLEAKLCMEFGKYLFGTKNYHRSFANYLKARNLYEDMEDSISLADASLNVAITQYYRGNYRLSIRSFLETVVLAEKLNLTKISSEANEYLGMLYNAFQNFSSSASNFKKALTQKSKLNDHKGYVRTALKLSEIYNDNASFDTAYYYSVLAHKYVEKYAIDSDLNNVLIAKAIAEINTNKIKDAIATIALLDKIVAASPKDNTLNLKYYVVKGNYHLMKGEEVESASWHNMATSRSEKMGYPELISFVYRNISIAYSILKNYKAAYESEKKSQIALSQALTGEQIKSIGNLELVYGKSRSDEEVRLLNAENKLKQFQLISAMQHAQSLSRENNLMDSLLDYEKSLSEALEKANAYQMKELAKEKEFQTKQNLQLEKERKLTSFLWITLIALTILGGLLLYYFRRTSAKNSIIKKQAEDLQNLMKEIHHRVKNNLQVVSSLLNLQSNYIKDAEAIEAVKDSRNRVFSMALVHQQLYQDDDLRHVDVSQYIESLCSNLMSSLNVHPNKILIEKEVEKIYLNDEILMPLGLILNELITNSIKYAFPQDRKGVIKIKLYMLHQQLHILFKDNGIGMNTDLAFNRDNAFGFKMIKSFLQKLKGTIEIINNEGTEIRLSITKLK